MIQLDAATVLLQWAVGGMAFCWFTTRRQLVGLGYGWMLRGTYLVLALLSLAVALRYGAVAVREASTVAVIAAIVVALAVSIHRRSAGVSGQIAEHNRRSERVAAMTGIERAERAPHAGEVAGTASAREFPPILDLVPALFGAVGLVAAAIDAAPDGGRDIALSILRILTGAAFLGAVTNAMLLGHWYLVQPGLPRRLLNEIVTALAWIWPVEVVALLLPVGMVSVWNGTIDDGWGGMLGWFWAACAVTTIVLVLVTKAALKERQYSAVMAATGLLYLAILTAFGTDLVARAVLSSG